jgi:hypothetical protein
MDRSPGMALYPLIAGILFAVGAIRFYMRGDTSGMIINIIAAIASFLVSNFYLRSHD